MAPLALIGGIPLAIYQRSHRRPVVDGWDVIVIPSQDYGRADVGGIWERLMDAADDSAADGIHLILAHDTEEEHPSFSRKAVAFHRVIWLERSVSRQYGSDGFTEAVRAALLFEDAWRIAIRPKIDSPLLLPESSFSADGTVKDMWRRASSVRPGKDSIQAVESVVARFRDRHRKRRVWSDRRSLAFDRGSEHAFHIPRRRRRKLTCDLPTHAIGIAGGDVNTGISDKNPSTRTEKGPVTRDAVVRNQRAFWDIDPSFPAPPDEPPAYTWLLLYYIDEAEEEVRVEFSLPSGMTDDGYVAEWDERIILTAIPYLTTPILAGDSRDDFDDSDDEIDVERRTG